MSIKSLYGNLIVNNEKTEFNSISNLYKNYEEVHVVVNNNDSLKQMYSNMPFYSTPIIQNAEFIYYESKKYKNPKKPKTLLPSYVNKK